VRNGGKAGGDTRAVGRTHHDDSNRSKNRGSSPTWTLQPIKFRLEKYYMLLGLSETRVLGRFNFAIISRQKHKKEATGLEGSLMRVIKDLVESKS
jgi:hypothetical protein